MLNKHFIKKTSLLKRDKKNWTDFPCKLVGCFSECLDYKQVYEKSSISYSATVAMVYPYKC